MTSSFLSNLQSFFRISLAFLLTILCVRIFEYTFIAARGFVLNAYVYEAFGLLYDLWACLIYSAVLLVPFLLLSSLHKKSALWFAHGMNVIMLVAYLGLLVVFSERTRPFDHEFFTRDFGDSLRTTRQMMASGVWLYLLMTSYIGLYALSYVRVTRRITFSGPHLVGMSAVHLLAFALIRFSMPLESVAPQISAYYLVTNKFSYWVNDCFQFLSSPRHNEGPLTDEELRTEVEFYQQNHPFEFTSTEYPLLHRNVEPDVLGGFFNLNPTTPPNIVILVVEGLSRGFSGENAYATSFTPFLDSLSKKSLVWNNFLSTAPATFAAHPAISGSLPYGKRGFALVGVLPEHLSLIKILRQNGYRCNFMVGFDPDFDNMGGYIRQQGTDFVLSDFGRRYKKMGIGAEGWSMGYPDDALFQRSMEVLDSLPRVPTLNIFHTATTHMPYLFEQSEQYGRLFDEKMRTISVPSDIKSTLKRSKKVLVTFMFSDDCIKKFISDYSKRPDFNNTIFFITGDHHIGAFPSISSIDDYHVPLIVYSPMLKAPRRFNSVNSHNNLTPTICSLVLHNYKMSYVPPEVHWLGSVLDTCTEFRNIHSMAFMSNSRAIEDYIYKEYFLTAGHFYQLSPTLEELACDNDSMKHHVMHLLDNFKHINSYVCDNNKVYPPSQTPDAGRRTLLYTYHDSSTSNYVTSSSDTSIMNTIAIPKNYRYIYVELSGDALLAPAADVDQPTIRLSLVNEQPDSTDFLYWTKRNIVELALGTFVESQWNHITTNDLFALDKYKNVQNLHLDIALFAQVAPLNLKLKDITVGVYGVR